jgi:hypothetical protein
MRQSTICSPSREDDGNDRHRRQQLTQQAEQRRSSSEQSSFFSIVQPNDVLMGRGETIMRNQGNLAFIEIIRSRSAEYHATKSRKKITSLLSKLLVSSRAKGCGFAKD